MKVKDPAANLPTKRRWGLGVVQVELQVIQLRKSGRFTCKLAASTSLEEKVY